MENDSLHTRLDALRQKIESAEKHLHEQEHQIHDRTHLTAQELKDRYKHLQERLNREVADDEAHGHHVTDLERSVRQWLESFDTHNTTSN